jgi:hypothetical protein
MAVVAMRPRRTWRLTLRLPFLAAKSLFPLACHKNVTYRPDNPPSILVFRPLLSLEAGINWSFIDENN